MGLAGKETIEFKLSPQNRKLNLFRITMGLGQVVLIDRWSSFAITPSLISHPHTGTTLPTLTDTKSTVEVSLTFRPLQQNGLLLLITTDNQSEPVFAAGMFNGEVSMFTFILQNSPLYFDH